MYVRPGVGNGSSVTMSLKYLHNTVLSCGFGLQYTIILYEKYELQVK